MRKLIIRSLICVTLLPCSGFCADKITTLQIIFMIKQIFPEVQEISIFISSEKYAEEEKSIARSSAQHQIKVKVHKVDQSTYLGQCLNNLKKDQILLIYDSELFNDSKTRLYILSKCKDKKVSIVTTNREYSDAGALLGIVTKEESGIHIIVNLKFNEHQKNRFTPEFIMAKGIAEVIE